MAGTTYDTPLAPPRGRLKRGLAATVFLRQNFEANQARSQLRETYAQKFFELSLDDRDVASIRAGTPLRLSELRRAAFREQAGWEYPIQEERAAFILLPDVQESRMYFKALAFSERADIKEGKLADATDNNCVALGLACASGFS